MQLNPPPAETSELRTLFLKHVVVNHLSCRAIHGMHHLGRNPDDGQAEHENAVAVTSLIEITSPLNTLFVKLQHLR